jgi:hypothetical protein
LTEYFIHGKIKYMWKIERTQEYSFWYKSLDEDAREAVLQGVLILSEIGPILGRPQVDTIEHSKYPNMKELRVQNKKRVYRIFFAFDKKRVGILLIGGDKKGLSDSEFYGKMIPIADEIYRNHIEMIEKEDKYDKKRKK